MTTPPVDRLLPIHPGSFLRDELAARNLSARKFAEHIEVAHNAITAIMNGTRGVTPQMAVRIGQALGQSPDYWLSLQTRYDLKKAHTDRPISITKL